MTVDILYRIKRVFNNPNFRILEAELYNYVLYELEKLLNLNSTTLSNFNLPLSKGSLIEYLNNKLLQEEVNYDTEKLKIENKYLVKNLNREHKYIYKEILKSITPKTNMLFFICGHGGTRKIYLWNAIITKIRSDNKIVLAIASS